MAYKKYEGKGFAAKPAPKKKGLDMKSFWIGVASVVLLDAVVVFAVGMTYYHGWLPEWLRAFQCYHWLHWVHAGWGCAKLPVALFQLP